MTIFVTADIPAYACADSLLEQCWRETVAPQDIVYVIAAATAHWILPQLELLPGRIRLVPHAITVEEDYILSPLPLDPAALPAGKINLHGRPLLSLPVADWQYCVSIDATGFKPVTLAEARVHAAPRRHIGQPALRIVRHPLMPNQAETSFLIVE